MSLGRSFERPGARPIVPLKGWGSCWNAEIVNHMLRYEDFHRPFRQNNTNHGPRKSAKDGLSDRRQSQRVLPWNA